MHLQSTGYLKKKCFNRHEGLRSLHFIFSLRADGVINFLSVDFSWWKTGNVTCALIEREQKNIVHSNMAAPAIET